MGFVWRDCKPMTAGFAIPLVTPFYSGICNPAGDSLLILYGGIANPAKQYLR